MFGQTPSFYFPDSTFQAIENGGGIDIAVFRAGDRNAAVTVDYSTTNAIAVAGEDYVPQTGTLAFAAGETNKTFRISILDDGVVEGDEWFRVILQHPTGGAVIHDPEDSGDARVLIQDNEKPYVLERTLNPGRFEILAGSTVVRINAVVILPDNDILIGGEVENGTYRGIVARFGPNGARKSSGSSAGFGGQVNALAFLPGGELFIGSNGGTYLVEPGWWPGRAFRGVAGFARALAAQGDGKVLVGGIFFDVGGVRRNSVARLDSNGDLDPTFNAHLPDNTDTHALAIQGDGRILVGGLLALNPFPGFQVIRLSPTGGKDPTFTLTLDAPPQAIVVQPDGKILVGGEFTSVNGATHMHVARFAQDGSVDQSFDAKVSPVLDGGHVVSKVSAIALQADGKLLIGGAFELVGNSSRAGVARLNPDGSLDATFQPGKGFDGDVLSITTQGDGQIVVGGMFTTVDGQARDHIARLNSNTISARLEFSSTNHSVLENKPTATLTVQRFGEATGPASVDFATANGTGSSGIDYSGRSGTLSFATFETAKEIMIPIHEDELVEAKENVFVTLSNPVNAVLGNAVSTDLVIFDNERPGSIDTSFNAVGSGVGGFVFFGPVLSVQPDGKLLLAGAFGSVRGLSREYNDLLRFNFDGSVDTSFKADSAITQVQCLGPQPDGKIVVGGYFNSATSSPLNYVARLNADGTLDSTFDIGVGPDDRVSALAIQPDGKVIIGGYFTAVNTVSRAHIARLNRDGSLDTTFEPGNGPSGAVESITLQPDGKMLITGSFGTVGNFDYPRIARLHSNGALDFSFSKPDLNSFYWIAPIALQPDGRLLVGGGTGLGGLARNQPVRLEPDGSKDAGFVSGLVPNGYVRSIAVGPEGRIIVGGATFAGDGSVKPLIARLNPNGSVDSIFVSDLLQDGEVMAVTALANGRIFVAGGFTTPDGRTFVVRLNGAGGAPRLNSITASGDQSVRLTFDVALFTTYRIEASTDLDFWLPIATNTTASSRFEFLDTLSAPSVKRFYRIHQLDP